MDIHQVRIYNFIRARVLSHDHASDIAQNTFVKVWKGLASFRYESSLSSWIHRIAINETNTFLKKNRRYTSADVEEILKNEIAQDYFDDDEALIKLHKAIATLPERQREVFIMRYFQETPYKDMAEILSLSEGSIKASYHIATTKIHKYIKGSLNDPISIQSNR